MPGILEPPALTRTTGVAKPTARRGYLPLASPLSSAAAGAVDLSFRTIARLGARTGRWRIGFANRNLRSNTVHTTPCTISGVFIGTPVYGTTSAGGSRWTGAATAAMTAVSGSLTVPTDGSTAYTNWITDASSQFDPFVEKVIGWGHTSTNSGNGYGQNSTGYQAYFATGSSQAGNATLTSPSLNTVMYLDIIIEYEFATPGQIGLFVGDSNTFGVGTSAPALFPGSGVGTLPHEAWPNVAAEIAGFSAINLGVGGALLADFATTYPGMWTRMDLSAVPIDFAVVSLGTNGLSSSQANFDTFTGYIRSINSKIRSYGVKRIYWTDITPRGLAPQTSTLAASTAAGATTFQTAAQLVFDDGAANVVIGSDTTAEFVTVASTTPTGSGPYTYTVASSGTLANAHASGDAVTCGREAARRRLNAWLRNMPDGISGVIPFESVFEASPLSPNADPRLVCSDALHFVRGAGMARAAQAVVSGVQPKLS